MKKVVFYKLLKVIIFFINCIIFSIFGSALAINICKPLCLLLYASQVYLKINVLIFNSSYCVVYNDLNINTQRVYPLLLYVRFWVIREHPILLVKVKCMVAALSRLICFYHNASRLA